MSDDGEHVERERRQLVLMLQRIEVFRQNYLSLGRLIADLEGLLAARQRVSEKWIDDFRSAWGDLDIPYAVLLIALRRFLTRTIPSSRTAFLNGTV